MDSSASGSAVDTEEETAPVLGLTRRQIFVIIKKNLSKTADVYTNIEKFMSDKLHREFVLSERTKVSIRKLSSNIQKKWQQMSRSEKKFFETFSEWIDVFLPFEEKEDLSATMESPLGRPSLKFAECSDRTKRRRTVSLRSEIGVEELSYANQMSLRSIGKLDAAKVVEDVALGSPSKGRKYRESLKSISENTLSPNEAVSLIVENKLSRSQYQSLLNISKEKNCNLYPSYKIVYKAKLQCYPLKSDITETKAEFKVQALLDHTTDRILSTQKEVIKTLSADKLKNLTLICKWGCGGTSGQSRYKQKFTDDNVGKSDDANIFFTSLVPLQLISMDEITNAKTVVWKHPRPSSPRFCRPLRIQFLHENTEATVTEVDNIKEQVDQLVNFEKIVDGREISVAYQLALTMIDGKVCNAITGTESTQRCHLCDLTSKDFNKIDQILQKKMSDENLKYGLSTLHAWIRFFECCLHVSYKLDVKKWQVRNSEDKEKVETRKRNIQTGFRRQLGLIVEQPKPGFGRTNDGNTARRFFKNADISAEITGYDKNLIEKFHVILQAISSGYDINVIRFQDYALQTARDFVQLYPWYYMPTSVHKLLIHGSEIITSLLLPIGQMSALTKMYHSRTVEIPLGNTIE